MDFKIGDTVWFDINRGGALRKCSCFIGKIEGNIGIPINTKFIFGLSQFPNLKGRYFGTFMTSSLKYDRLLLIEKI